MKIAIMTDLEGLSMVSDISQMTEGYDFACSRLMEDVNAAVDAAFESGVEEVFVIDGHGTGKNFIPGALDKRAKHISIPEWEALTINRAYDATMFIGAHAMAGTTNAFLDHTQSSKSWFNYYVNGKRFGEIGEEAMFAGFFGIPLIAVSGDEAACVEAKAFLGDIPCAVVKYAIGRNRARVLPSDEALCSIRAAVREGISRAAEFSPFFVSYPAEIKLEYYRTDMCDDICAARKNIERLDARCVRKVISKIECYTDMFF